MINGLKTDITTTGLERGLRIGEKSPRDSFANELKGAQSEKSQPTQARPANAHGESLKARLEARRARPKSSSRSQDDGARSENFGSSANPNALANPNSGLRPDSQTAQRSPESAPQATQDSPKESGVTSVGSAGNAIGASGLKLNKPSMENEPVVMSDDETAPHSEAIAILEAFGQDQSNAKQEAIGEFMTKMQREFGIAPEKIVEAFTKLDGETLAAPPEQAMNEMLSKLELAGDDLPRAQELFSEMVQATGAAEAGEKFASLEDGVNFEVLSAREAKDRKLDQSLDRMNDKFFARASEKTAARPMTLDEMNAQIARLANQKAGLNKNETLNATTMASAALASIESGESEDIASAMPQSQTTETGRDGLMAGMGGLAANESKFSFDGGMNQQSGQDSSDSSATAQKNFMGQLKNSEAAKGKKLSAEFTSAMRGSKSAAAEVATGEGGKDLSDLSSAASNAGAFPGASKAPGAMVTGPAGMMMSGPQMTGQDEVENIKEVIKQAQVMLKRGGGEMKLEMSPEGMGQLHLKVAVENGQVNVQMVTESDSAKKMIENGLHELKASLAAHKLHVERMQVEIGQEIQKQMDQQGNQDASRQQARQMAQDFLGQFRDDRESFRQSMFDGFGSRGYGREPRRSPITPEPVVTQSAARARYQGTSGERRLNLVA